MKRIITFILVATLSLFAFSACSQKEESTVDNTELETVMSHHIDTAIELLQEREDITLDKNDYTYKVNMQIDKNKVIPFTLSPSNNQKPTESFEDVIQVVATHKKDGKSMIGDFSISFNSKSKEVIAVVK